MPPANRVHRCGKAVTRNGAGAKVLRRDTAIQTVGARLKLPDGARHRDAARRYDRTRTPAR